MKFKPIQDRIIVKVIEEKATSGIIIPDIAKKKPKKGKVMATGLGSIDKNGNIIPMKVKKDDVVLFTQFAGQEVVIDREKYLIMKEDDVLAVEENPDGSVCCTS